MEKNKRGQMAIFVIIAIVVVAGILAYVIIRNKVAPGGVSSELAPVYEYYDSCIKEKTTQAIQLAESQGGYVDVPNYIPGSEYAPSSSQLNFLGFPVPYWYYISGNGIAKEQVPTKQAIEKQISDYVTEHIGECDYKQFYSQGFSIQFGSPTATVSILDDSVAVNVNANVIVSKGEETASQSEHSVSVNSELGKFYSTAVDIYNYEQNNIFLENYSVDVLRLYAPVDGVEMSCTPKIWKTQDVLDELKTGLEANIEEVKFRGGQVVDKYFTVDHSVSENVNFMYSPDWPTRIQISGGKVDEALMTAEPAGSQQSLGVAGFCYVPYHFVYDLSFPVLVQIYNNNEIFQFPVIVVINGNMPRQAEKTNLSIENETVDICAYNTQPIAVNLYGINLNKINGNVSYQCFNQECNLGETTDGTLNAVVPSCYNGYLNIQASGYADKSQLFSSNSETNADVILDKKYTDNVELDVDGKNYSGSAVISFVNQNTSGASTALLPDMNSVTLSEGSYQISVYVYGNSSIVLPESTKRECTQVPKSGVLGFFGGTEDKCVDVTIPSMTISSAILGGGSTTAYILPSDLEKGNIRIGVQSLPFPNSLEQLQYNFESFSQMGVSIDFG